MMGEFCEDKYDDDDDDDVYAKLVRKMNRLRVVIDNDACDNETVIRVDSVNKHGTLLGVVQVLADLNLIISKAYMSSDGCWFMDVFKVTDSDGNKILDEKILSQIQMRLEAVDYFPSSIEKIVGVLPSDMCTSIELTGTDRPGLLSEVSAVLTDLQCNVVKAEVWTHNARAAAVLRVTEESTGLPIEDPDKLSTIKELLCNVLKGDNLLREVKMSVSVGSTHTQRRLHQMMLDDRDYERNEIVNVDDDKSRPQASVTDCRAKDYTVVILKSKDRPKLLFDTVCTLTDMQYVVFHGTVDTGKTEAYQEYYIRHINGLPIRSEAERQRVIQCLEAAIQRRAFEGLELEVRTEDRVGLLSDITRVFRENGLTILRAEICTQGGKAIDTFYVSDMSGNPVDEKTIDSIRNQMGQAILKVKNNPFLLPPKTSDETSPARFLFGNFFKGCSFQTFRLIRSLS